MSNETANTFFPHHRPTKRLGQNFLKDTGVIKRIIESFSPQAGETVIEVGPGKGALTSELVDCGARVVAVEFDRNLAALLSERFAARDNFRLLQADALETDFCAVIQPACTARLIANLPYNISTAILQRLITQRSCLEEMVLMLQKEVVERIQAPAGSSDKGYLSVLVEAYCETEKLFDVSPGSFKPRPKVWSTVIRIRFRSQLGTKVKSEELLWSLVSAGFRQKRKTILNNLRNATGKLQEVIKRNGGASIVLCKAGVNLQRRAESLTLEEWGQIVRAME
ncbi:MAG TPA: 16S rRNA (adenine(1518)-N(6)/adenine(1519)-N(6))-dimethyltransferase RsmA [Pyrinomonadaceae bacterium]|nr:16S rRNA (adenine(1518)-N(6)/adenine(1519)-N(6))-dimethyltransferase RsmA [Pyrinomonadaceae bacterium]